jgi:dimethylamine monooxygenase subunit B
VTELRLVVRRSDEIARDIREIVLARPDGGVLPAHPAGSHLVVECRPGRNAYSLTNSGLAPREYTIAVLRHPEGSGGSRRMHRHRPGDEIVTSRPRSNFAPVLTARRHLLVAGGIGITPVLAHARDAVRLDRDVELLHTHRPGVGAFASTVEELLGDRSRRTTDRTEFTELVQKAVVSQPLGTHLYVCGPVSLMDFVAETAATAGWPPQRIHRERFTAADLKPGRPFTARLARSGRDVPVASGTSLLDALHHAGIAVSSMCGQGVCGECRLSVLDGRPRHRDEFLDESERATSIMACVSRSETDILEVDL